VIYLKNNSGQSKDYLGKTINSGEYRLIPESERVKWANNSTILIDIANSDLIVARMNDSNSDITDVNEAINFLKSDMSPSIHSKNFPFADKVLEDGRKVFRRKHGEFGIAPAEDSVTIQHTVLYAQAKINKVELTNCKSGDQVNLKVYDNAQGHIQIAMGVPPESVTPNLLLNQFGFDVEVCDGLYVDESNYDADLIAGMIVELTYKNNDIVDRRVGMNITLHELV